MSRKKVFLRRGLAAALALGTLCGAAFSEPIRQVEFAPDPGKAEIQVRADRPASYRISRLLTGKFAEHLWWNIYNGMDAQILRNPTFGEYTFRAGPMSPDGVALFLWRDSAIDAELQRQARRYGWPETALEGLVRARRDGLACFWARVGPAEEVRVSPDVGPKGSRAQRIQIACAGQGVCQWTWLPAHRTRRYELAVYGRAPEPFPLKVELRDESGASCAEVSLGRLADSWGWLRARLELPADVPPEARYRLALLGERPGQAVLRCVFLRPADHVEGFDPDVVRLLKALRLPLLRWPGGNFVSGYHWRDGVGPAATRPSRPNYAWGGVEPNTFGTDEFLRFCRVVGCEPMICVNAGSGSPEEAAAWVEYCNGATNTPMGALRAANGHPEPYRVRHWEIGNELWGRWQFYWTTPEGYADRFDRFVRAMRAVDPTIQVYACGEPVFRGSRWNRTILRRIRAPWNAITDHPLIGGSVPQTADPLDVYRDFMAVPEALEAKWAALREEMSRAGVKNPRLGVTELQLFARVGRRGDPAKPVRLTSETLPRQSSITEAVYDTLIYHACVRLGPFVSLVTHSAVVNHGGGLRKERERVWADPCYYARAAFAVFCGRRPLPVRIRCGEARAPGVLPDLRAAAPGVRYGLVDALAAEDGQGGMWISLIHRGTDGPIRTRVRWTGLEAADRAELWLLQADKPWQGNTLGRPDQVAPRVVRIATEPGALTLELPPFSVARLRIRARKP